MVSDPQEEIIDPEAREHLSRLGDGAVILARDALQDPNFIAALVLICIYTKDGGAYGLVINRPSHMPLSEVFDGFSEIAEPRKIFIGGPVQQDEVQIIQITDEPMPDSRQIAPRIYLGGKWENVDQMLMFDDDSIRLFLGYSGWAASQLEAEVAAGAWEVYRIDIEKLLMNTDRIMSADVKSIAAYLESIKA